MSKSFWAVIAAIVLIFVGIYVFTGNKDSKSSKTSNSSSASVSNHTVGKGTTGVTLVEYGDFQCPYCGQYYPILKQVQTKYNDQITFQFRHFPLTSVHQNAFAASRAAEAAGLQGKFWEMYDQLYPNQQAWSATSDPSSYFENYARIIGLDVAKFKKDYASTVVNDTINADMAAGTKLGITGTPTFYLNGKKIDVTQSVDDFSKQIDAAIAKKSGNSN